MSPKIHAINIQDLIKTIRGGHPEALGVLDYAFEKVICEGNSDELEKSFWLIEDFLADAAHVSRPTGPSAA